MMPRVPEPDLMLTREQAKAYASVDMGVAHQPLIDFFRSTFGDASGQLLDLGCGPADISIRFVRALPEITAVGVDGSDAMLAEGRAAILAAGLQERITLEKRYLPDAAIETRHFDLVVSNSLLHHLADPRVMWRSAIRAAKPGAPVAIMDLSRPDSLELAHATVDRNMRDAPAVLQSDFFNSLCAAYTPAEVRGQLDEAGLVDFRVIEVDDVHQIIWGRAPLEAAAARADAPTR
jgi:SAM-dependent methyltransferase